MDRPSWLSKNYIIQHRGKQRQETPPNSFDSLLQHDVDRTKDLIRQDKIAIETDAFLLSDGNIVLLHPTDAGVAFDKLSEIESLTLGKLNEKMRLAAIARNQPETTIPTLEDYIQQGMDRGLQFFLDLKGSSVESSVRIARAVVQKIHELRKHGLFKWKKGMVEKTEEYVRTYPQENIMLHSLSLDALQAAREEMKKLNEPLTLNLGWVASPLQAKKYHDLVDGSIECVRQKIGPTANQQEDVMDLPADRWLRYGIDIAADLHCRYILTDKSAVLTDNGVEKKTKQNLVDYAHEKGIKISLSMVRTEDEASQLLQYGVDKIMFEPS